MSKSKILLLDEQLIFLDSSVFEIARDTKERNVMTKTCSPGEFMIIGRRDDSDEIVVKSVQDVPKNPTLTMLCRRALYEMGLQDPLTYEFIVMTYARPAGGTQVILDQNALRRYVHANYG